MQATAPGGDDSSAAQPNKPPREGHWIEEFRRQATSAMRRRAVSIARRYVQMNESTGGLVTSADAEDLVDDALADTWRGVLTWNPTPGRTLLQHVLSAVRSRARHARERAERFPTASLDAHDDGEDDECASALWSDAESALAARVPATIARNMLVPIDVWRRLRVLASGDLEVLSLLDAMRAGATERADLMHVTGMSARRYESARRRLDTLLLELPTSAIPAIGTAAGANERQVA